MAQGLRPAGEVLADGRLQRVRAKREVLVVGDVADVLAAEAGEQRGLIHRAVAVRRGVDHERRGLRLQAAAAESEIRWRARARRSAPPACRWRRCPESRRSTAGEAGHAAHPVGDDLFESRSARGWTARRARARRGRWTGSRPARSSQFAVGGEVAEETRMLPVGEAGHDDAVDVGEDGVEGLGVDCGGSAGSAALISPGAVRAMTGRCATVAR